MVTTITKKTEESIRRRSSSFEATIEGEVGLFGPRIRKEIGEIVDAAHFKPLTLPGPRIRQEIGEIVDVAYNNPSTSYNNSLTPYNSSLTPKTLIPSLTYPTNIQESIDLQNYTPPTIPTFRLSLNNQSNNLTTSKKQEASSQNHISPSYVKTEGIYNFKKSGEPKKGTPESRGIVKVVNYLTDIKGMYNQENASPVAAFTVHEMSKTIYQKKETREMYIVPSNQGLEITQNLKVIMYKRTDTALEQVLAKRGIKVHE